LESDGSTTTAPKETIEYLPGIGPSASTSTTMSDMA
jgi:hypothetical protein